MQTFTVTTYQPDSFEDCEKIKNCWFCTKYSRIQHACKIPAWYGRRFVTAICSGDELDPR